MAMAAPAVRSLWSRIGSIPTEHVSGLPLFESSDVEIRFFLIFWNFFQPFAFGVVLSGIKTSFSDLLVQKVVEQVRRSFLTFFSSAAWSHWSDFVIFVSTRVPNCYIERKN